VLATLALTLSAVQPLPAVVQAACTGSAVVCENLIAGTPESTWDINQSGDPSIQGFATDISYNKGDTATFKVSTPASAYTIDIYRMGYYQGNGARKIASVTPSATLPQTQPACLTNPTGLVDCGNWGTSASWTIPTTSVSGIYFARLSRSDTGGASHIHFIVRDDASTSPVLFQTSDSTWQAYNQYGGTSLYMGNGPGGGSQAGRAYKVSYNRPFATRSQASGYGTSNFVFYAEYPMVRWLEANGYDVSYFTDLDSDRRGALIKQHRVFLSVGHDEYWSGGQRANVEAARDAGVNLAFLSGNEMYWKTRWENSIDGTSTPNRTLVTYKESLNNAPLDPQDPTTWTGLWRDPRFSPPADGGRPENGLTGTIFMVNRGSAAISVPSTYAKMRLWRNTAVANLTTGSVTLAPQTLGYEWDQDLDNPTVANGGPSARPAGLIDLSSTTITTADLLTDYGSTTTGGTSTATHHLTMYKAPSGALVFGAGTVQWTWGLDVDHDVSPDAGGATPDTNMRQATLNVLADMGAQPTTLQPGLVLATASTDATPPTSSISSPANGGSVVVNTTSTISGTAADTGGGVVAGVEVSTDSGASWHPATGLGTWSYVWKPASGGTWNLLSRAADDSGNLQSVPTQITVTVTGDVTPPTITNVTVGFPGTGSATVNWTTNKPSSSQVQYGPTTAYGSSTTLDATLVTSHSQTITGLTPGSQYNYRVLSKDQLGNLGTSANFALTEPVPASLVRVGDQNVEAFSDVIVQGTAQAFLYTATTTGRVTNLFAYTDAGSSVGIGMYADAANNPGTLLAQGTITNPLKGGWNNLAITPVNVTAGARYWLALLAPAGATTLNVRDTPGGGRSVSASQTGLSTLPTAWSTGSTWPDTPASVYAADLGGPVDTTPPSVSITAPLTGATVAGATFSVSATASDPNSPVSSVQFLLDGAALGSAVTAAPYQITWDTTTAINGSHNLGAQARDPSGNIGTAAAVAVTVTNPPRISGVVTSNPSPLSISVGWNTNVAASSQVNYGLTSAYTSSTTLDPTLLTSHAQTLSSLKPATLYHYQVVSTDGSANTATSADLTFTTPAFVVSAVQATSITTTGASITWTTNAPADTQVDYGTTASYTASTPLNSTLVTSHSVPLTGLTPSTVYHYRASSHDAPGDAAASADLTFTTAGLAPVTLVGDTAIEANVDFNAAGAAEAFQYTATTSGTANKLFVYVDSGNTATSVVVGLYTNSGTSPGTLLAQATLASPVKGAWNSAAIPGVTITAGTKYWLAILGPLGAGQARFRDVGSGGLTQNSSQTNLTTLPATWSPGATWGNAPMSAYAVQGP
jgi:hypothetical protein